MIRRSLVPSVLGLILGGALPALAAPAGTIEVRPRHPTTAQAIEFVIDGDPELCWPAAFVWTTPFLDGQTIIIDAAPAPGPLPPSCNFPGPHTITMAPLDAGFYSVEFRFEGDLQGATAFEVEAPTNEAALRSGRFIAYATFRHPAASAARLASAVELSDESAHFWFFGPKNVELTLKILDGRGVNGHFWIFIASMTDVEYTVTVTDTERVCVQPGCNEIVYHAPAGQNRNFIDTSAF